MNTSRLLQLSSIIAKATEIIHNHLQENDVPFPTFDKDGSTGIPHDLFAAKNDVIDAASELHDLLLDPIDLLAQTANVSTIPTSTKNPQVPTKQTCELYFPPY